PGHLDTPLSDRSRLMGLFSFLSAAQVDRQADDKSGSPVIRGELPQPFGIEALTAQSVILERTGDVLLGRGDCRADTARAVVQSQQPADVRQFDFVRQL